MPYSFPIPDDEATLQGADEAIAANAGRLMDVLTPIAGALDASLGSNQAAIDRTARKARTVLTKAANANDVRLASVMQPVAAAADTALSTVTGRNAPILAASMTDPALRVPPAPTLVGSRPPGAPAGSLPPQTRPPPAVIGPGVLPPGIAPFVAPPAAPPAGSLPPGCTSPPWTVTSDPLTGPGCFAYFVLCPPTWTSASVAGWTYGEYLTSQSQGASFAGPYATEADAQEALLSGACHAPGTTPAPPPAIQPPPPIIAPPAPPDTCPTPPAISYWIRCRAVTTDAGQTFTADIIPSIGQPQPSSDPQTEDTFTGPYDSEEAAQADFAQVQQQCVTQIGPPLPAITCTLPDVLSSGIPVPGSPEWCAVQDQLIDVFAALGNAMVEWALAGVDSVLDEIHVRLGPPYSKANFLSGFMEAISNAAEQTRAFVLKMLDCWRKLAIASTGCKADAVLGIAVVKGVLDWFRSLTTGWSVGVVITGRFDFELRPISRMVDYVYNAVCPTSIPGIGEARSCYLQDQIDADTYRCWLAAHGAAVSVYDPVLVASAQTAGAAEWMEYVARLGGDSTDQDRALQAHGWLRDEDRQAALALWHRVPELETWVSWFKADVLDADKVERYGLLEGFDDEFWPQAEFGTTIKGRGKDSAQRHFAAAYLIPDLGAAHQMLYRLREGKPGVERPFGGVEFADVLGFKNYPTRYAEWLTQIAYRVIDVGQALGLVVWHHMDWNGYLSTLLDNGYDDPTARLLMAHAQEEAARQSAQQKHGWTLGTVAPLVRQGVLKPEEAQTLLSGQGYRAEEIDTAIQTEQTAYIGRVADRGAQRARMRLQQATIAAYQTGSVDRGAAYQALRSTGYDDASANTILSAVDMVVQSSIASKALTYLHHAYLRGEISYDQTVSLVASLGITPERAATYLAEWHVEFASRRPMLTTQKILGLVAEGLLDPGVAQSRLRNLGWGDADLGLLESEVNLKAQKAVEKARQKVMARTPVSKLHKLYVQGVIDAAAVEARLAYYGFQDWEIALTLESWELDFEKAHKAPKPKPPKPPPTDVQQVPLNALRALYLDRLLTWDEVYVKLLSRGYDPANVELYHERWDQQLAYRDSKAKPPAPV